jgi:hypothetical protein
MGCYDHAHTVAFAGPRERGCRKTNPHSIVLLNQQPGDNARLHGALYPANPARVAASRTGKDCRVASRTAGWEMRIAPIGMRNRSKPFAEE